MMPDAATPLPCCSDTVLSAIGNTPLLDMGGGIYAKAEFLNPSGSIKARIAKYMIEKAEAEGLLKPGDTIVEATSGNTGNAMSMVAAAKGYKMKVLMPAGYTTERVQISRGYGAELEFVGHFQVNEALEKARMLGQQDGYYNPGQFDNNWNMEENRDWLGREVIAQLPEGVRIDAIVQGVGTGGTLLGVAAALKAWHNPDLKVFAMEPSESRTIECCIVADHAIEGISDGFIPTLYHRHRHLVDDVIHVQSEIAITRSRDMASRHGLFVGPSSGANLHAAEQIKSQHPELQNILNFFCDGAEKYLSLMNQM